MTKEQEIYFTSDLHFGHENIIKYCNRPFNSVEEMNEGLIELWNSVVDPNDTVWILGDLVMGRVNESLKHVERLNGFKVLFCGNHDRPWKKSEDSKWFKLYKRYLNTIIVDPSTQTHMLYGGLPVEFSHFPFPGSEENDNRYQEECPPDTGQWLIHGHVHDAWRQKGRLINVGIDAWAGKPVSSKELFELIGKEANLPRLEWT